MTRTLALLSVITLAACNQAGLTPTEMIATETSDTIEQNPGAESAQTTGTPDTTAVN